MEKDFFEKHNISAIFKNILTTIDYAIVITDKNTRIIYANQLFLDLYGYKASEIKNKMIQEIVNSGVQDENFYIELWNALNTKGLWKNEIVNKNKNNQLLVVQQTVSVVKDKNGNPEYYVSISHDISKLRNTELNLIKSNRRFEMAFLYASIGKAIMSIEGKILKVNKSLCDMLGYTEKELTLKTFLDITYPEDLEKGLDNIPELLTSKKKSFKLEKRYVHKNGDIVWVQVSIALVEDVNGKPLYFISEIENITQLKKYISDIEIAKEQAEKSNKLKDAFISTISHEIQTPLNGILGLTDIIKNNYNEVISKDDHSIFELLDISTRRLIRTINHILTMSQLKADDYIVKPEKTDLDKLIQEVLNEYKKLAQNKKLSLTYVNYCQSSTLFFDKCSVFNALQSIIDNAFKFTQKGSIDVVLNRINNKYILEIKDSGIGISEEYLERIFEPYSQEEIGNTRKYDGIGLGLSTAKLLLEKNNIAIYICSEKSKGTTVTLEFPVF